MHDAVDLSGGSSQRPPLEPHHFADSTLLDTASCMGHNQLHLPLVASLARASSGKQTACSLEKHALPVNLRLCLALGPHFRQIGLWYG